MDFKALIKKRGSYKAKLTLFNSYLDQIKTSSALSAIQVNELNARLAKVEELYSEFDCIQIEIENLCDIPDDQYKERACFEDTYFGAVAVAREVLCRQQPSRELGSATGSGTVSGCKGGPTLKLPTINLPTFSGQYHDWLEFRDTYTSLIHSNETIPKINKFHYLRAALKDSAALIIRSLDFSLDNYDIAWDLLCDRYDNKRLLVNNHIQAIFNMDTISRESAKALRDAIDTVNRNLRALKTLELPVDGWDILIIHIVSNKLDSVTSREWETFRNTLSNLPTLVDFNKFLKNRADLLETMEEARSGNTRHKHNDNTHARSKTFTVTSQSQALQAHSYQQAYCCPLCKNNHAIHQCSRFKSLPVETRIQKAKFMNLCLNCLRRGHFANTCKLGPCRICQKSHNTLLHITEQFNRQHVGVADMPASSAPPPGASTSNVALCAVQPDIASMKPRDSIVMSSIHNSHNVVLLSTALIQVDDCNKQKHVVRVLLDNGSTSSFITESLCAKLNLLTSSTSTLVEGLNCQSSRITKHCGVVISSLINSYREKINCFVVPCITQSLPSTHIEYTSLNIPEYITLADPSFHTPSQVDMLLGADIFWGILRSRNISLGKNKPTLSETEFGWLVSGIAYTLDKKYNTVHCHHTITQPDAQLQDQLTRFFELETFIPSKPASQEEEACESHFTSTTTREDDGRFVVKIPLKMEPHNLGTSYEQALSRFISLERKFRRDPSFKTQYTDFIKEYIALGHMSENTTPESDTYSYVMPHHGVVRETSLSTKLRVVFDASAVTSSGLSFNNIQRVGPTVQNDLISIIIRFRQHKYVVTADVEKMYRMVKVDKNQHSLQQILWRFEPHEQLKLYKLHTITYGTASAPYLATRCLVQLGKECTETPVSQCITQDFYVDDFLSGHSNASTLIDICKGVIKQLNSGQFNLRKWHSNNSYIIQQLVGEGSCDELLNLSDHEYSKTLGLIWACKEDALLFSVEINNHNSITKRTILSTMAQIFDPLGLINPCILQAKTILQELWASKITWDEHVPCDIQNRWQKFVKSLLYIKTIKIPRHVICEYPVSCEIHAFSDASTQAYSACIYLRSVNNDSTVTVHLLTAKSRVAPLKPVTIPRLELCGALLAARLADKVKNSLRLDICATTFWCDSTIVLGWIKTSKANLLKQFVYNRINEINTLTESESWRYVPTHFNPADIGSRGADAQQLKTNSLWWSGPQFLKGPEAHWPCQPTNIKETDLPEFKIIKSFKITQPHSDNFFIKYSEFGRLQTVLAYVQRFIYNCCNSHTKRTGSLTLHELNSSLKTLCRLSQLEIFESEYNLLKNGKELPVKNKLINLSPFIDADGLMRVGGRLSNSHYDYDTKHPILLHASQALTNLIFKHYHKLLMHAGPQLLLANIRHKFWAINGRNLARKTVHNCIKCCRFSGRVIQPIMGNLPEQRLHAEHPFINTAVDYAGPIMILNRKGRGSKLIKSYLCIFICLAIRAVHVELVTDLSSETFIAALDRFIARRGKPDNIFSDNGTCFVGACNELSKFLKLNSEYIGTYATKLFINFKFSPAYSPHFNGLAEGAVKSVKHHLKRILAYANLTYEEMNTVLTQIEAILNSRPLTPLSSDPSDLAALTPSHFLIGRTLTLLAAPQVQDSARLSTLSRYRRVQQLKAHFWERFYKEYISDLQKRQKWCKNVNQLQLGEMVLVKDDRLPPNRWLLGRVETIYPGSDGIARVADIKTTTGTLRRAYNRLCPLPVLDQPESPGLPDDTVPVPAAAAC